MNNIVEEITRLTEEWYKLIGGDHHKDRDCHWYVETKWSYGQQPTYTVQHFGYILDDITIECCSYEQALACLKNKLEQAIKQEQAYKED